MIHCIKSTFIDWSHQYFTMFTLNPPSFASIEADYERGDNNKEESSHNHAYNNA